MKAWLRQHAVAVGDVWRQLRRAPGGFLLNLLVIAVALSLPIAGLTVLDNIRPLASQLAVEPEISIFLAPGATPAQARALEAPIREQVATAGVPGQLEFVPREQALSGLKTRNGLSEVIIALGNNPLPDSYVLRLRQVQNSDDARRIESLALALKGLPGVDYVQIDTTWVRRLAALVELMQLVLLFLSLTLAAVVVAVVFNTVRLQVLTQREEIVVARLFGATDAFIRRPFYYTGALLGLLAGLAAITLVSLSLQPLNATVTELARLYASDFSLHPLGPTWLALLLAIGASLGLLGAVLSVRRQLHGLR